MLSLVKMQGFFLKNHQLLVLELLMENYKNLEKHIFIEEDF